MNTHAQDEVNCVVACGFAVFYVCSCIFVCLCVCKFTPHLFLILILQSQPLLNAGAGLQEDFPLGAFGENPHKHPRQVDADEQHRVGHQLHTNKNKHAKQSWQRLRAVCASEPEGTHICTYVCLCVLRLRLDSTMFDQSIE